MTMNAVHSKYTAFSLWPRESSYVFGSEILFNSSFCINCYYSTNINRGFEVDSSHNSSDIYFSHNVENARECLFCFNVKNLSYAIANAPLGKEKYLEIKKALLEQIRERLEKKKSLGFSVYG